MKKNLLQLTGVVILVLTLCLSCKKTTEPPPCDNKGKICITNKLNSTATINFQQVPYVMTLEKDYMECIDLTGDIAYTLNISYSADSYDTIILVKVCDNISIILE